MRTMQRLVLLILVLLFLYGCSRAAAPRGGDSSRGSSSFDSSASGSSAAGEPAAREESSASSYAPSLGTEWGERIDSRIRYVSFEREDERSPDDVATIHYDDRVGIHELAGVRRERSQAFITRNGNVEFGLTDKESFWSRFLPGLERSGKYYVRGNRGDRYAIYVRNRSDERIEIVLSVDGLDVMNGRPASFSQRGYILEPGEKLEVEGFRDSRESVAAFRFADVERSYVAEKGGDVGNVGVVGLAVFVERGASHYASHRRGRHRGNPFPGEFATAP